ncbi:MAG: hypothetical protein LBJ64_09435 [Deltaproteobacteria bacterium]|jgi:hypothetical protein|nr:hypothetical protein [Deltaproteobacteria bacterium]
MVEAAGKYQTKIQKLKIIKNQKLKKKQVFTKIKLSKGAYYVQYDMSDKRSQ